ncbi:MAG: hypothetical protein AB7N91_04610 [Candidatus Tectimicrobiota bacterium]
MTWSRTRRWWRQPWLGLALSVACLSAGCTADSAQQRYTLFPPQEAMEQGDYAKFHSDNMLLAEQCTDVAPACAVALFNLGFVYAYPASPYYNPAEALRYFGELAQKYPQTPWAAQGQAWMALLKAQNILLPAQGLMSHEDYQRFRNENMQVVQHCSLTARCDMALFNLGFVHAYPASPYHNPAEALRYFGELAQKYPRTSWATQGSIWVTLLKEQYAFEEKQQRLLAALRTKEQAIRSKESAIRTKESAIRTQETALRHKDATIRTLQEQLDRARTIDAEIDKKERELLR